MPNGSSRCLKGLRVAEMSRVIAAPLCGKTLAAHGAGVIWVTSPRLPDLPFIGRDLGRGKRTVQLDIQKPEDKARLLELLRTCDVSVQGFRPGSLASSHGLSPAELAKTNPGIIVANMSAFGLRGPWSGRRGYDSLVQTCSGMNVSEAEHAGGSGEVARPTPARLSTMPRATSWPPASLQLSTATPPPPRAPLAGWRVGVSLAGVMKYLRSLGQYPGAAGFESQDYEKQSDVPPEFLETRDTGFGSMTAVRHAASVEGCEVGWRVMPKPLGSDEPEWL